MKKCISNFPRGILKILGFFLTRCGEESTGLRTSRSRIRRILVYRVRRFAAYVKIDPMHTEDIANRYAGGFNMSASALHPIQYNDLRDISVVPSLDSSDACLRDLREVLRRHNCEDKFGIALLHRHFDLADDEALLEHCDQERRELICRPVKRATLSTGDIQTLWRFYRADDKERECEAFCPTDANDRHQGRKDHY